MTARKLHLRLIQAGALYPVGVFAYLAHAPLDEVFFGAIGGALLFVSFAVIPWVLLSWDSYRGHGPVRCPVHDYRHAHPDYVHAYAREHRGYNACRHCRADAKREAHHGTT